MIPLPRAVKSRRAWHGVEVGNVGAIDRLATRRKHDDVITGMPRRVDGTAYTEGAGPRAEGEKKSLLRRRGVGRMPDVAGGSEECGTTEAQAGVLPRLHVGVEIELLGPSGRRWWRWGRAVVVVAAAQFARDVVGGTVRGHGLGPAR